MSLYQAWILALILSGCIAGHACHADTNVFSPVSPLALASNDKEQGFFLIDSVPPGADVYVDGAFSGETPAIVPVSPAGIPSHVIRVTRGGYQAWTTTYEGNPKPGQTVAITAVLLHASASGAIQVISTPEGAIAMLDRTSIEKTPFTFVNVPVGDHEVSIYLAGYQTFYTGVTVEKGQTARISATLFTQTKRGSLSAESIPPGAAVYIDGVFHGVTPTIIGNLVEGPHHVAILRSGFLIWENEVVIQPGLVTSISPVLERDPRPDTGMVSVSSEPAGADVYTDGVYVGQTRDGSALVIAGVKPGIHSLLLSRTGYQDHETTGVVRAGDNFDLHVRLNQVPRSTSGGISIVTSPSGAEVYLNHTFRGFTPLTIDPLEPGSYSVLVKMSGYQDWVAGLPVTSGQIERREIVMNPIPDQTHAGSEMLLVYLVFGVLGTAGIYRYRCRE